MRSTCPQTTCLVQRAVCSAASPRQQQPPAPRRRDLLTGLAALVAVGAGAGPAAALGLESFPLPSPEVPEAVRQIKERSRAAVGAADQAFEGSELLRTLRERTEANRASNKKATEDKYCVRQGEMGVGDCGGLRFIPGATRNGAQKRPEWLENLLGKEES